MFSWQMENQTYRSSQETLIRFAFYLKQRYFLFPRLRILKIVSKVATL